MSTSESPGGSAPGQPDGRPKLFLSHAGEDKDGAARPLAEALEARGVNVWYDEYRLSLGDSLSAVIDRGLRECTHGVIILSHSFFKKQWPQRELRGLVAREIHEGRKVILPVRHQISVEDVTKYSPPLGDKLSVSISDGIEHVADEIVRALELPGERQPQRSSRRVGSVAAVAAPVVATAASVGSKEIELSPDHGTTPALEEFRKRMADTGLAAADEERRRFEKLRNAWNDVWLQQIYPRWQSDLQSIAQVAGVVKVLGSPMHEPLRGWKNAGALPSRPWTFGERIWIEPVAGIQGVEIVYLFAGDEGDTTILRVLGKTGIALELDSAKSWQGHLHEVGQDATHDVPAASEALQLLLAQQVTPSRI